MQSDPFLSKLLFGLSLQNIDTADDTIFALSRDLTITYVNQGWSKFAERNGGDAIVSLWSVGCRIMDAVPSVLRPFFQEHFAKVLKENRPWEHPYECSSADVYRRYLMLCYPLGNAVRILVVNSLVQETLHTRSSREPKIERYRNQNGIITQCCHCRRVQRNGIENQWDVVPTWVKEIPPQTSHGLCGPCYSYYYSPSVTSASEFPETFKTCEAG